tara:strand:+ start:1722 stop:1970 length:249 start_codon:yes stop_codon:yes gene_type:complete
MSKKSKPKPKGKKRVRRTGAQATASQRATTQQQFVPIHNQSLKNSQRDQAEAQRISQAEEKEFKMDTLKLQRAYVEKKLSLL